MKLFDAIAGMLKLDKLKNSLLLDYSYYSSGTVIFGTDEVGNIITAEHGKIPILDFAEVAEGDVVAVIRCVSGKKYAYYPTQYSRKRAKKYSYAVDYVELFAAVRLNVPDFAILVKSTDFSYFEELFSAQGFASIPPNTDYLFAQHLTSKKSYIQFHSETYWDMGTPKKYHAAYVMVVPGESNDVIEYSDGYVGINGSNVIHVPANGVFGGYIVAPKIIFENDSWVFAIQPEYSGKTMDQFDRMIYDHGGFSVLRMPRTPGQFSSPLVYRTTGFDFVSGVSGGVVSMNISAFACCDNGLVAYAIINSASSMSSLELRLHAANISDDGKYVPHTPEAFITSLPADTRPYWQTAILSDNTMTMFGILKFASSTTPGVYAKVIITNVDGSATRDMSIVTGEYNYVVMDDGGFLDWLSPGSLYVRNGSIPGIIGQSQFYSQNYLGLCNENFEITAVKNIPADLRSMNPPDGYGVRSIGLFKSDDLTTKTNICGNLNPIYYP